MADQKAATGLVLSTSLQPVYANPADSGARETVLVVFSNQDGTNDATLAACNWLDADNGGLALAILPVNAAVKARAGVSVRKILDPGDSIQARALTANDIVAIPEVIASEPLVDGEVGEPDLAPAWADGNDFRYQFGSAQDRYWDGETETNSIAGLIAADKLTVTRSTPALFYDGAALKRAEANQPRVGAYGLHVEAAKAQYISAPNADGLTVSSVFDFDTSMVAIVDDPTVLAAATPSLTAAVPEGKFYRFTPTGDGDKYLGFKVNAVLPTTSKVRYVWARKVGAGAASFGVGAAPATKIAIPAGNMVRLALNNDLLTNTWEIQCATGTYVDFILFGIELQVGTVVRAPVIGASRGLEEARVLPVESDYDADIVLSDGTVVAMAGQSIGSAGFLIPPQALPVREVRGNKIAPIIAFLPYGTEYKGLGIIPGDYFATYDSGAGHYTANCYDGKEEWNANTPTGFGTVRQAVAKSYGVNMVRYFLNAAPIMDVLAGGALTNMPYLKANFTARVTSIKAAGFKQIVNFNLEVSDGKYPRDAAMDGPDGPVFTLYKQALAILGQWVLDAGLSPTDISITVMNEVAQPGVFATNGWADWATVQQPALYAALRAVVPSHTIGIQPWGEASEENVATLQRINYDRNALVDVHPYGEFDWAFQGQKDFKHMTGIPYEVDPATKSSFVAAWNAAVDADNTLTTQQKADRKALYTNRAESIFFAASPIGPARTLARFKTAYDTIVANGWSGRNLGYGEWGAGSAIDPASRGLFIQTGLQAKSINGFGYAVLWENGEVVAKDFGVWNGDVMVAQIADAVQG